MAIDTGGNLPTAHDSAGHFRAFGMLLVPRHIALSSTALHFQVTPGFVQIGHRVCQFRGKQYQPNSGNTLADGDDICSALVAYEKNGAIVLLHVVGTADTTADVVPVTDAEIEAALPSTPAYIVEDRRWVVVGRSRYSRSGSTITMTLDNTSRPFNVDEDVKLSTTDQGFAPSGGDGYYIPGPVVRVSTLATDWANGDLVTNLPIDFHGRIVGLRATTEVVVAGAGATITVNAEVGTTDVAGLSLTAATATPSAKGLVQTDTPTAPVVVAPGDTVSLEGASATSGSSGRVVFELLFETLVSG